MDRFYNIQSKLKKNRLSGIPNWINICGLPSTCTYILILSSTVYIYRFPIHACMRQRERERESESGESFLFKCIQILTSIYRQIFLFRCIYIQIPIRRWKPILVYTQMESHSCVYAGRIPFCCTWRWNTIPVYTQIDQHSYVHAVGLLFRYTRRLYANGFPFQYARRRIPILM